MVAFTESFQWFALLNDFVGCKVLGAVREYAIISVLVILICLGIQLLILMTQPRCLQVIKEEKQKKYKILRLAYATGTFMVPAIFVPWSFIDGKYGNGGRYICWLGDNSSCGTGDASIIITRILMWYLWAVLVWLFTVGVFVTSIYRYCLHKRNAFTKWKPDLNINIIISILTLFVVDVTINLLLLLWGWFKKHSPLAVTLLVAASIPLMLIIVFDILNIRQLIILHHKDHFRTNRNISYGTYSIHDRRSTSSMIFILPDD